VNLTKDFVIGEMVQVRGVFLRKWGMLVLDALTGHLTPDIKATITGSSMNTAREVIFGEYDCTSGGARCPQQLYSEKLLTGGHALTPAGRLKKPIATLLC
jgi:hypothetical protein